MIHQIYQDQVKGFDLNDIKEEIKSKAVKYDQFRFILDPAVFMDIFVQHLINKHQIDEQTFYMTGRGVIEYKQYYMSKYSKTMVIFNKDAKSMGV